MDTEHKWSLFVDLAAIAWIVLFVVDVAVRFDVVALASSTTTVVRGTLQALVVVFLLDLALLYRWADQRPRAFVRTNWLLILTVVPWFRPLRLLRIGRGVRALKLLAGSRRVGSLFNKTRRTARRYWRRFRE